MEMNKHSAEYLEGLKEGQRHIVLPPETNRRLLKLESIQIQLGSLETLFKIHIENHKEDVNKLEELFTKKIDTIADKLDFTNGKVGELSKWREQVRGASMTIKSAWGVLGFIIITIIYALFNMWIEFKTLDYRISNTVNEQLSTYEFEITK